MAQTSMQPVGQFSYTPLQDPLRFIRVVTIKPGVDEDSIELALQEQPLGDPHICLSYVWGPATDNEAIAINEKSFTVRSNLRTFLQAARRQYLVEPLWIDAICINQADEAEKSKQVQLMGQIYLQAKHVLVWLGLPDLNIASLLTLQKVFGGDLPAHLLGSPQLQQYWQSCLQDPSWSSLPFAKQFELLRNSPTESSLGNLWFTYTSLDKDLHDALGQIGHSSYFRRAWIVQEIMLAKRIMLISNSQTARFEPALKLLSELLYVPDNAPSWWRQPLPFENIHLFFNLARHGLHDGAEVSNAILKTQDAFVLSLDRGCQNPRDRIYSIRSLLHGGQDISVQYSDRLETVFGKTMNWAWRMSISTMLDDPLQALPFTKHVADHAFMTLRMLPPEDPQKVHIEELRNLDVDESVIWVRIVSTRIEDGSFIALVVPLYYTPKLAAVLPIAPPEYRMAKDYDWVLLENKLPFMLNLDDRRSIPGHKDESKVQSGEWDYLLGRETAAARSYQDLHGNVRAPEPQVVQPVNT